MSSLGQRLRAEREKLGVSRVDVAKATKVGAHHLAALEHDDFDALPDEVFVKGFVRNYAEYLGLDTESALEALREGLERNRPEAPADIRDEVVREMSKKLVGKKKPRWALPAMGLAVLAALVLVVWLFGRRSDEPPVVEPEMADRAVAVRPDAAEPAPRPQPVEEPPPPAPVVSTVVKTEPSAPPPAPPTRPDPVPTTRAVASHLKIEQHGVGTGVQSRRLVGESDHFSEGTRIWYWTRVLGGRSGDTVEHVWLREGSVMSRVTLEIGSANWRTQSSKTLFPGSLGSWAVETRDASGTVLSRREFGCEP